VSAEADAGTERRGSTLRLLAEALEGNDEKRLELLTASVTSEGDAGLVWMTQFRGEVRRRNLALATWRMREEDMTPEVSSTGAGSGVKLLPYPTQIR